VEPSDSSSKEKEVAVKNYQYNINAQVKKEPDLNRRDQQLYNS
jgi:hypothetical protein